MDLRDQRVVIMGGSSGIGLATARMLVGEGAKVAITGRGEEKIKAAVEGLGKGARGVVVDGTSEESVRKFFREQGAFEHLVIAVSGAAGAGAFRTLDMATLRAGFEAKFWAHVMIAQVALETLEKKGSITFISAGSARAALPETMGLAAINGELNAIVPTLALELKPLRVNAVSPGIIETPWWDQVQEEFRNSFFERTAASLPVGRVGQSEDVAEAIVFLIKNTFMTGTIIDCDGGGRLK